MPIRRAARKIVSWAERWRQARAVIRDSLGKFFAEDSLMVSASIAYHSLLSAFPMMLLLIGLGGIYIHRYELNGRLGLLLGHYLPMKPDFILRNLTAISHSYGRIGIASFVLLLWSSSGVFLPIERALNRAWEVEQRRTWVRRHLLALEMTAVLTFLVLVSTGLMGINIYVHDWMRLRWLHPSNEALDFLYHASVLLASFATTLAMFIVLFQRLPYRPMKIRQVIPSALLTALFWEGARSMFTLMLPHFNYQQVYGSIGALIATMTWMYISSAVMLFGAQVSAALYRTLELPPAPARAAPVELVQRAARARPA